MLGSERVRPGDVLVAMAASGLHSNGYSLVRRVLQVAGWSLDRHVPELGRTVGEELLEPTRLYTPACLALVDDPAVEVHAFTHVTGGGLAANLARVLPRNLVADVDRGSWTVPPVFEMVRTLGQVPWSDLQGTLNLGVGMVAVVPAESADATLASVRAHGFDSWVLGTVREDDGAPGPDGDVVRGTKGVDGGAVRLVGSYRTS